jgi:hypothetical protein
LQCHPPSLSLSKEKPDLGRQLQMLKYSTKATIKT